MNKLSSKKFVLISSITAIKINEYLDNKIENLDKIKNNQNIEQEIKKEIADNKIEKNIFNIFKNFVGSAQNLYENSEKIFKIKETNEHYKNAYFGLMNDLTNYQNNYLLNKKGLQYLKNVFVNDKNEQKFSYNSNTHELKYKNKVVGKDITIQNIFQDFLNYTLNPPMTNLPESYKEMILVLYQVNNQHMAANDFLKEIYGVIGTDYNKNPIGDFYNPDNIEANDSKTVPTNIFAYYYGYDYCVDSKNNRYYPEDKCVSTHERGIKDNEQEINDSLDKLSEFKDNFPKYEKLNPEEYVKELKIVTDDITDKKNINKEEIIELLKVKENVFIKNMEAIEKYIIEISEDKVYENTIKKLLKKENNHNKDSEKKLSFIDNLLPNSKIGTANNLSLYNFMTKPVQFYNNNINEFKELITKKLSNNTIIYLIIIVISIFIILFSKILPKKNKKK